MTVWELAPAADRDGERFCPLCIDADGEADTRPLTATDNDTAEARTLVLPGDHVVDMAALVDDTVHGFGVVCHRHDLACLFQGGLSDGWVGIRIRTDHGVARTRIPEADIVSRPADVGPTPDGYQHVVRFGPGPQSCTGCQDPATMLARDPADRSAVDHPDGAFFCDDCAATA